MKPNYLKRYIVSSYILVWVLILFVAGMASLVFHAPPVVMWVVRNLIAWSPTYLLLLGWKHFRPNETRTAFVKRCFSGKIKPLPLLLSFALTVGISVLALCLYAVMMRKPLLSCIDFGTTALPLSVFLSFTSDRRARNWAGVASCGRNSTKSTAFCALPSARGWCGVSGIRCCGRSIPSLPIGAQFLILSQILL